MEHCETCKSLGEINNSWQVCRLNLFKLPFILTLSQTTNFELFQIERVRRRQLKLDDIGWKVSKWVENSVGKGEIAHYEQFLLFLQCFQKACFPGASRGVWEWVNCQNMLIITPTGDKFNLIISYFTDQICLPFSIPNATEEYCSNYVEKYESSDGGDCS